MRTGVLPMTILQVYHTMGMGGVGSYLFNLSTQLIARGHRVLLAAPEGPLTSRMQQHGIDCRTVPIGHWRLLRVRGELTRIIQEEGVQVVSAQDYNGGLPAYLAAGQTQTPYVLTIHCRRSAWQRLVMFYWSAKVITVSPGLRQSLIRQLGLPANRVIETVVGVDTTRFAPGPVAAALAAELGISPNRPVVLHVSRLSPTKSAVALALAQAAQELIKETPDLLILVAGTGEDEGKVRMAADLANRHLGREVVRALGARNDVPELMRLACVVVGTATVVLEAMASHCPVVAAGKFGFLGTITAANFESSRTAFFGDHAASGPITADALVKELRPLLRDAGYRRDLADWGYQTVTDQFSLTRMTDQMERVFADMVRQGVAWGRGVAARVS